LAPSGAAEAQDRTAVKADEQFIFTFAFEWRFDFTVPRQKEKPFNSIGVKSLSFSSEIHSKSWMTFPVNKSH
jgi:hypothetical protein